LAKFLSVLIMDGFYDFISRNIKMIVSEYYII